MDFAAGSVAPTGAPGEREAPTGWQANGGPDEERTPVSCERCGAWNGPEAHFCQNCGGRLTAEPAEPVEGAAPAWNGEAEAEALVVTAVACEISPAEQAAGAWSPAATTSAPPETVERLRAILEAHGGSARELAGSPNAVVAVFGLEPSGGDAPLRAIRAAAEVRTAFTPTGNGPGATMSVRAGVGASEVLGEDSDAEHLWRERVVDLAVRLQRMAQPGEVIVSEGVYRRTEGAARFEPVDARASMEGNSSVGPLRLLEVAREPVGAMLATAPLVARERELATLRSAFDHAATTRARSFVRMSGAPGIGKSRTAEEFLRALEDEGVAAAIRIRCLPPYEGGTTQPLADLVAQAAGVTETDAPGDVRAKIEAALGEGPETPRIVERLLPALGLAGRAVPEETAWALGRLLCCKAADRPLVVFIDDADRAGPGFHRLLREAIHLSSDATILVLRTESEGAHAAVRDVEDELPWVELEPLEPAQIGALAAALLGDEALAPDIREAVSRASGGSPFLAEQLVAMLIDEGYLRLEQRRWVSAVGPSEFPTSEDAGALLEARLRDLDIDERAVIGLAAVVGEHFAWAPLADLVPEGAHSAVMDRLHSLVGARLLTSVGEGAFAFTHALIRRAAGGDVPDEVRAHVHERYARWLEGSAVGRAASDELIGSHLEAAWRAGAIGERAELARTAGRLLAGAATTAAGLGDAHGAAQLAERASLLFPPDDPELPEVLIDAAKARTALGEPSVADGLLARAGRIARVIDDIALEYRIRLLRATLGPRASSPDAESIEHLRRTADETIEGCAEVGDDVGLALAWGARGLVYRRRGHWAAAADAAERAAEHARRAGRRSEEVAALRDLAHSILDGRAPIAESIERCERVLERARGERPGEQEVAAILAQLLARRGAFEEARELVAVAMAELEGVGMDRALAVCLHAAGRIDALSGPPQAAEQALRRALEVAERVGDPALRAQIVAALANVIVDTGRADEALQLTETTEPAAWDDVPTRVEWGSARAKALAATGRIAEANRMARPAVKLADQTDLVELRAAALLDLAEVLRLGGRPNEARPFTRRAMRAFQRKGANGATARARAMLERLDRRPEAGDEAEPAVEGLAEPDGAPDSEDATPTVEWSPDEPPNAGSVGEPEVGDPPPPRQADDAEVGPAAEMPAAEAASVGDTPAQEQATQQPHAEPTEAPAVKPQEPEARRGKARSRWGW